MLIFAPVTVEVQEIIKQLFSLWEVRAEYYFLGVSRDPTAVMKATLKLIYYIKR